MSDVLIFGGTTEGREIATYCDKLKIDTILCVATEYGKEVLPEFKTVKVSNKRLGTEEIAKLIKENNISYVIDSTHPYAYDISKNIESALKLLEKDITFLKIKRESMDVSLEDVLEFSSNFDAVNYLLNTEGNILLTTGSKEISAFSELSNRIFPRVLPSIDSINACISAGVPSKNIIAMQGPFSMALNEAIIKEFNCKYLVSKLSGRSGGFEEKIEAAKNTGCIPVIIMPKTEITGISVDDCKFNLKNIYSKQG